MPLTVHASHSGALVSILEASSALLIDFNGTLSDDEELLFELLQGIARDRLGIDVSRERYFAELVGHTEERMFREIAGGGEDELIGRLVAQFNRGYLESVRTHRRVSEAAEAFVRESHARGKRVAVVTAASKSIVVPALSQIDLLDSIDAVVALEDVADSKPAPDCYLLALEALEVRPEEALAFEDSIAGATAAHRAGVRVVGVGPGMTAREPDPLVPRAIEALDPALFAQTV